MPSFFPKYRNMTLYDIRRVIDFELLYYYPDNLQINMYRQAVSHNNLGTILYRVSEPAEDLKIRMGASFNVV